MKAFAGIGSRNITEQEKLKIAEICEFLNELDYVCYSGNATGSDITFQQNVNECVVFLPWNHFNFEEFNCNLRDNVIDCLVPKSVESLLSITRFHPNPLALSPAAKSLMIRNYFQIMGYEKYPAVDFVICCADEIKGNIQGGTGQACRISKSMDIPVFNLRYLDINNIKEGILTIQPIL